MVTRREVWIAIATAAFTASAFAVAGHAPILGSDVFSAKTTPSRPTTTGAVRSFFRQPTATLKELEVHETTLNPGQSPHAPHRHPNEELIILRQGTLETLSNGTWERVGPGAVIFNASNQLHGLRNVGNEAAVYDVINWKSDATPVASGK